MKNQDTYFLVKSLKKGDLKSFEKLYRMYYSKLHGFSNKFYSPTLQADDFVQQTFLKVWDEREHLKEDVLFDKQLYVICRNLILNNLKREKKMVSNQDFHLNSYEVIEENEEIFLKEELDKLNTGIEKLPKKRREIFLLHKRENLTYEEIAQYLFISTKTIANHIYLASNFLKEEFKKF
ncbi:sigma-70 family RNA polymerase sigma factor [Salegentibacter sp. F188]|uniref:Sigma-70 family RNA polymerase sigma factor n=1 Tax=Autumnicola patrickiae TaxID=3075591 RepID=A0ABU3DZB7_9FLAO|nr:sigma-70 family RNA polymerase sigma factor [Salegentibacter sp. F188]MDT0689090.1 sigma-70 family RNA polymerase sigma factor [Salegentibacter sp. F188]